MHYLETSLLLNFHCDNMISVMTMVKAFRPFANTQQSREPL